MTNEHTTETSLSAEQIAAFNAETAKLAAQRDGETSHEEAEVFVTEDTADHVVH
jgi:hypothetical protein